MHAGRKPESDRTARALAAISAWRQTGELPQACPVCSAARLSIDDRSARPYAEWYVLECAACGYEETIQIPLAAPNYGLD